MNPLDVRIGVTDPPIVVRLPARRRLRDLRRGSVWPRVYLVWQRADRGLARPLCFAFDSKLTAEIDARPLSSYWWVDALE